MSHSHADDSWRSSPLSIPCGHMLCVSCRHDVAFSKSGITHSCLMCRNALGTDDSEFSQRDLLVEDENDSGSGSEESQHDDEVILMERTPMYPWADVKKLEEKVARIAEKRCSRDEVHALYQELSTWMAANADDVTVSLTLSAALLKAILTNYGSHTKSDNALRSQVEDLGSLIRKQDEEIARLKNQALASEALLQRPTSSSLPSTSNFPPASSPIATRVAASHSKQPSWSMSTEDDRVPGLKHQPSTSPFTRWLPDPRDQVGQAPRSRSGTTSSSGGPNTVTYTSPAPPAARSHTPAQRSYTPGPSARSHTPGPPSAPVRSHTPSARSHTPGVPSTRSYTPNPRSYTPAPPTPVPAATPPTPRRPSFTTAPRMLRSTSDANITEPESARESPQNGVFTRWVPSQHQQQAHNRTPSTPGSRTALPPAPALAPYSPTVRPSSTRPRTLSSARAMAETMHRPVTAMKAQG